jgi:phosphohistidine phosphatase
MKILTLFRHAKSSWDHPELADRDRPLNKRGERDAPAMAERLKEAGIRPSLILSSPAVRTWKTARKVAKQIGYPLEFLQREPGLYHAGVNKLLDIIAVQDDGFNNIVLIGHNPGLTDLANELEPGLTSNIPTSGFVTFRIDTDDWDLRRRGSVELVAHDYPKKKRP